MPCSSSIIYPIFLLWYLLPGLLSSAAAYKDKTVGKALDLRGVNTPSSRLSIMRVIKGRMMEMEGECEARERPFVTLCYAQSLDGSISLRDRTAVNISSFGTLVLAHEVRAEHDCILIGAGTAKADNPKLTVRYGIKKGSRHSKRRDPRPVILISAGNAGGVCPRSLRVKRPILFSPDAKALLGGEAARPSDHGFEVVECRADPTYPQRCDLQDCLHRLWRMGYRRLMVEGGGGVISAFAASGLVDLAVITVSPRFLGGFHVFQDEQLLPSGVEPLRRCAIRLKDSKAFAVGPDVVLLAAGGLHKEAL